MLAAKLVRDNKDKLTFTDEELEDEVIVFTNWYSNTGETDYVTMLGSELGEPPEEYCVYLY